ncbi:DHA2 family efflux MFS transporter permease subunit [Paenibacillus terrigena]|uniref:DHA2 family efflux MFS transporter permease subunit n=1 Tax=Paenibacillus terrigena TaxID=369333 RepID=UPI00036C191F|nr:DHA2 family efflux MFS transporter permease subunit [Paenibacillus terrigena]
MKKQHHVLATVTLLIGFFMAILDTSIVNVVLPKMASHYGASVQNIAWVANGYSLSFAVFLLTASRLADQFGRKKSFMIGLLVFTLSSLLCGTATSIEMLITYRILQGVGAALIVPLVAPLLMNLYPPEKKTLMVGIMGALGGLAAASGPALGGILSDQLTWQWIFYINVPLGVAAFLTAMAVLRESSDPTASRRLDVLGMLSVTIAALSLTLAFMQANDKGWSSIYIMSLFAIGIISLFAFLWVEAKAKEPMMPLSLFRPIRFTAGNAGLFLLGIGMTGPTFVLAFFLTAVGGKSELHAGFIISVLAVASMFSSILSAKFVDRLGSRMFTVAGMLLLGLGTYLLSGLNESSTTLDYVWRLIIAGMGTGMTISTLTATTLLLAPMEKATIAMGIGTMARTMGTVFGIAILVALLTSTTRTEMKSAVVEAVQQVKSSSLDISLQQQLIAALQQANVSSGQGDTNTAWTKMTGVMKHKEQDALAAAPATEQGKVKAKFAAVQDQLEQLWSRIQQTMHHHLTMAFSTVFKFSCLSLVLGAIFAYINGEGGLGSHRRQEKKAREQEIVTVRA